MMVFVQQIVSSTFLLLFGVLALLVWRRYGPVRRDRAALGWALTATTFLVVGVYSFGHALFAAVAGAMGTSSVPYRLLFHWALAANLARDLTTVVYGGMLLALMLSRRRPGARLVRAAPAVLLASAVFGTLGLRALRITTPYAMVTAIAVAAGITAIVMMVALFAAIHTDGLDQLLWLALAIFTLKQTVSVSLLAVMAAWTMDYAARYFSIFYWVSAVLEAGMIGVAARRLHLASGGRRVPAPFERVHAMRRPAHG